MRGLRWWRRAQGLTQAELAEASGVERSHLARIERGEVDEPRPDTLRRLAEALGVEVLDLFLGKASIEVFVASEGRVRGPEQHHQNITATSHWNGQTSHEAAENRPQEPSESPPRSVP